LPLPVIPDEKQRHAEAQASQKLQGQGRQSPAKQVEQGYDQIDHSQRAQGERGESDTFGAGSSFYRGRLGESHNADSIAGAGALDLTITAATACPL
jgi:hypothetical protein